MRQRTSGNRSSVSRRKAPVQKKKLAPDAEVSIPEFVTVKHLAEILVISPIETIKRLMRKGLMVNVNQVVDYETAADVAIESGFKPLPIQEVEDQPPEKEEAVAEPAAKKPKKTKAKKGQVRPPVVTVMGHVDHGKTSLLDAIRHTNVTEKEAGEITQHIGAYQVDVGEQKITFIDTPGHEAFTNMRARGAGVTDIVVQVISAEDGIMPQTVEAIDHARAAGVPMIIAINKIDKPDIDIERLKQQLAERNLLIEEWGGDVIAIPVSAKTGEGIPELLEHINIVAEMAELTADPERLAKGVVLEARLDNTRGSLTTLLVQDGTLKIGDIVIVGETLYGKVKAMFNNEGERMLSIGPSTPVEFLGLSAVPQAGDPFEVVSDERLAKARVEANKAKQRAQSVKFPTLDDISSQIRRGETKGINLIIKADVQGSIDPIQGSLERLENDEVKIRVAHSGSGSITESDIMLAAASKAIVIGFNTRFEPRAKRVADAEGIEVREYNVIYKLLEDLEKTVTGMLEPVYVDAVDGHAEVRALFDAKGVTIAGCYISDGKVSRGQPVKVMRKGKLLHESSVSSLKRFADNVNEISAGTECGIGVEGISDIVEGDILEFYHKERQ